MAARIVLFGATGYTGRLTAEALVERGARPVLAGRNAERLEEMSAELGGGLETAVADVARPESVRDLVGAGDVLIATVGPFARWGGPAAEAAIAAGASYLDSTGEPAFIREVFESYGPRAAVAGAGMLTAFGYDWVPGNLAGALALREAGEEAARVDVGYFVIGDMRGGMSGGTRASLAGALVDPAFSWRGGSLRTERGAARVRRFDVDGSELTGVSVGSSEHFALPRLAPGLREVGAYLGWFGPLSRPMQAFSAVGAVAMKLPGARALTGALTSRMVKGSTGGPDAEARLKSTSHIVGIVYDANGKQLSEVHVAGVNGYDFTGRILAWGAARAAEGGLHGAGALGPAEAFGLDELEQGCAEAGIARV